MLPSETMIWQPEFTDKTLSRKPGAVQARDLVNTFPSIKCLKIQRYVSTSSSPVLSVPDWKTCGSAGISVTSMTGVCAAVPVIRIFMEPVCMRLWR
ncbi:hypothetical protein KX748_23675, partial [Escherichia coli]|uniref:hypothetical protein n=1 Tax=Escherichia coli TaxID=562 RepID=UPI001C4EBD29